MNNTNNIEVANDDYIIGSNGKKKRSFRLYFVACMLCAIIGFLLNFFGINALPEKALASFLLTIGELFVIISVITFVESNRSIETDQTAYSSIRSRNNRQ
jgi:hypothetical protein